MVYAGGAGVGFEVARQWWRVVHKFPNGNKSIHFSGFNPGYQDGARYAMHALLSAGWARGYEWVVRINPDVLLLDEACSPPPPSSPLRTIEQALGHC